MSSITQQPFDPSKIDHIERFKKRALGIVSTQKDLYVVDLVNLMSIWYDESTVVFETWRLIDYGYLELTPTLALATTKEKE